MRSAKTPLGLWQYDPRSGLNILDTEGGWEPWRPVVVSIALTGQCYKGCDFCYTSSTRKGNTRWIYSDLRDFIVDLDLNGVFSVTLGGGEPVLWHDPSAKKTFYDLIHELSEQVSLNLTFTTSGIPELQFDSLPPIPVRLSCHHPEELDFVLHCAASLRRKTDHVGINFLLWRSRLSECREAIHRLVESGFNDILLLVIQTTGLGINFAQETVNESELDLFVRSLDLDFIRLTACKKPRPFASSDMGCGANEWFVSVTEHKVVQSCSFADRGNPLREPTYQALLQATQDLPRLPCYRSFMNSPMARIGQMGCRLSN